MCGIARVLRFQDGKVRQEEGQELDVEVSVQEQQSRMKHEKGEGETERDDTHATNTPFMTLSHACTCTRTKMCKCDCARAMCRKMCVLQVSVCTPPVVHTVVATTCVRNPSKKLSKKINIHHCTTILTNKILQFFAWVRNPFQKFSDCIIPCPS